MRGFRITFLAIIIASCSLDDDQRCPDGFEYDKETRTCFKVEDGGTDTDLGTDSDSISDTDTLSDNDGGAMDDASPDDNTPTGYGQICQGPEDCAAFEANYCGIIPGSTDGYCTIENCTPPDCPDGAQCCDCSALSFPIICANDEDVENLLGSLCNCE